MVFADYGVVLRQPGQFAPGGGGPTTRSWRCGPCERESELDNYGFGPGIGTGGPMVPPWTLRGYAQGPEAGGAAASLEQAAGASVTRSIAIGVATGLSVWVVTKLLDRYLLKGGKRR